MATTTPQSWYVYLIQTDKDTLYTGITTCLERRLKEHQSSKKGAKFFSTCHALKIVYYETHPSRSQASKREAELKKLKKHEKLSLIKNHQAADSL